MLSKLWKLSLIFVIGVLHVKSQNVGDGVEKGTEDVMEGITETEIVPDLKNSGKKLW